MFLTEVLLILLVCLVVSQVLIPTIFNWPLFWLFRRNTKDRKGMEQGLIQAGTRLEDAKLRRARAQTDLAAAKEAYEAHVIELEARRIEETTREQLSNKE